MKPRPPKKSMKLRSQQTLASQKVNQKNQRKQLVLLVEHPPRKDQKSQWPQKSWKTHTTSPAFGNSSFRSSQRFCRRWRQQLQQLQRELIEGDFSENGKVRETCFCLGDLTINVRYCKVMLCKVAQVMIVFQVSWR